MSKKVLNAVMYNSNAGRTLAVRMALFIMAEKADNNGYNFVGPGYIADVAGGHKAFAMKTARRALQVLCEDGEIILWQKRPSKGRHRNPKYESIITVGQDTASIYQALLKMNQSSEQALATIEGLAKGEAQFFYQKTGRETQKTDERPAGNGRETQKNGREPQKTGERPAHPYPSLDPSLDPSDIDPSEREDSLSKSKKPNHDLTANGSEPPPNCASPPPSADDLKLMAEAVCKACGKKGKPSSRDKGVAWQLLKKKYSSEQVELLAPDGAWFTQAKPFGLGKTPLHRSQLIEKIDQCLAWHQSSSASAVNAKVSEYAFKDYSASELTEIRQQAASSPLGRDKEAAGSKAMSAEDLEDLRRSLGL